MVGAGGIGCELLKTLVLTGFENITLVSMHLICAIVIVHRGSCAVGIAVAVHGVYSLHRSIHNVVLLQRVRCAATCGHGARSGAF